MTGTSTCPCGACCKCNTFNCIEKDGECTDCYMRGWLEQIANPTYSTRSNDYIKALLAELMKEVWTKN